MPQRKKSTSHRAKGNVQGGRTTLLKASGTQCFWVHNGPILSDLRELRMALKNGKITDQQWKHHTSSGRNDFASWIHDIFRNDALAKKISAAKTKAGAANALETSLKQ